MGLPVVLFQRTYDPTAMYDGVELADIGAGRGLWELQLPLNF